MVGLQAHVAKINRPIYRPRYRLYRPLYTSIHNPNMRRACRFRSCPKLLTALSVTEEHAYSRSTSSWRHPSAADWNPRSVKLTHLTDNHANTLIMLSRKHVHYAFIMLSRKHVHYAFNRDVLFSSRSLRLETCVFNHLHPTHSGNPKWEMR